MKPPNVFRPCESDKLRVRRHVALTALAVQVIFLLAMLALYFFGSPNTAAIVSSSVPIMVIIVAGLNAMTWLWFRAAYKIDMINAGK